MSSKWCKCPKCGNPHFLKVLPNTKICNFPAYCKKCKNEIVINVEPRADVINGSFFVLRWRNRAEAAHRVHTPEIAGSIPASAIIPYRRKCDSQNILGGQYEEHF